MRQHPPIMIRSAHGSVLDQPVVPSLPEILKDSALDEDTQGSTEAKVGGPSGEITSSQMFLFCKIDGGLASEASEILFGKSTGNGSDRNASDA